MPDATNFVPCSACSLSHSSSLLFWHHFPRCALIISVVALLSDFFVITRSIFFLWNICHFCQNIPSHHSSWFCLVVVWHRTIQCSYDLYVLHPCETWLLPLKRQSVTVHSSVCNRHWVSAPAATSDCQSSLCVGGISRWTWRLDQRSQHYSYVRKYCEGTRCDEEWLLKMHVSDRHF